MVVQHFGLIGSGRREESFPFGGDWSDPWGHPEAELPRWISHLPVRPSHRLTPELKIRQARPPVLDLACGGRARIAQFHALIARRLRLLNPSSACALRRLPPTVGALLLQGSMRPTEGLRLTPRGESPLRSLAVALRGDRGKTLRAASCLLRPKGGACAEAFAVDIVIGS